jgi:hypothetical protein
MLEPAVHEVQFDLLLESVALKRQNDTASARPQAIGLTSTVSLTCQLAKRKGKTAFISCPGVSQD